MKNSLHPWIFPAVLLVCMFPQATALAESGVSTGSAGNTLSTSARLNLRVVIPRYLHFRVGSAGDTVDTLSFEPLPGNVGSGNAVIATGSDAATGDGTRVALRSNAGRITIIASNDGGTGGLGNGGAISLSEIEAHSDNAGLATPPLTDSGGSLATTTPTRGNVTDRTATWRYLYRNDRAVEPGTYSAEIIYTAVSP